MRLDLLPEPSEELPRRGRGPRAIPFGQDRLGNNTEAATLITAGRFAGQVAVLDGYDVIAVPVEGEAALPPARLFGIEALEPIAHASGLAYARSERRFFFNLQGQLHTLWLTDEDGNPGDPRPITYLPGFDPALIASAEGMTILPQASAAPDRLGRALYVGPPQDAHAQIEILTLEGVVEREIRLGAPLAGPEIYVLGLTWLPDDRLLISLDDGSLWTVGMDGAVLAGPVRAPDLPSAEALVRLNDGRVMAATYASGRLLAFDANLARVSSGDRTFPVGPGLSRPLEGVWDALSGRYLMLGIDRDQADVLAGVPAARDRAETLFHTPAIYVAMAALPDEDAFAFSRAFAPLGIDIVGRDGALREQILLANVPGLPNRRVVALAYVPTTQQFVLSIRREPGRLWLVSRAGVLDGTLAVPPRFGAVRYVPEDGQDRLHIWTPPNLQRIDLAGNPVGTLMPAVAGLVSPLGYVAGPDGECLLIDPNNSEVVRVPVGEAARGG
jgi:hypothetical protein